MRDKPYSQALSTGRLHPFSEGQMPGAMVSQGFSDMSPDTPLCISGTCHDHHDRMAAHTENLGPDAIIFPAATDSGSSTHPHWLEDRDTNPQAAAIMSALHLTQLRRFQDAETLLNNGIRQLRGSEATDAAAAIIRAHIRLAGGRFTEARGLASDGLAKAGCVQLRFLIPLGHIVMASASLRQGDLRTAVHYSRLLAEDALFGRLKLFTADARWVVAQTLQVEKGTEAAAGLVREVATATVSSHDLLLRQSSAAPWLVRFALATGDRATATQVVRAAEQLAAKHKDIHTFAISALHATGLLTKEVDQLMQASIKHADPWTQASAMEDGGTLLATRNGGRKRAVTIFELALERYHSLGALQDVSRVRYRLRSLGNTYHHTRWSGAGVTPLNELTEAETRVADLVSQGLTNIETAQRIYVSRHTVAHHLKNIFKKLGVTSRGELTRLWVQRLSAEDDPEGR